MLTHVVSLIDDCETAGDVCKSVNVLQAIRWIGQAWEGESNLADELCKIISKAQSLYVKKRLANAVQKNITDFFNAK